LVTTAGLALLAVLASGSWTGPAVTPSAPPAPRAPDAVARSQTAPPVPAPDQRTQPMPPPRPALPAVASAAGSEPVATDDVSRLRARALTLPVSGVTAAQLVDTYRQSRADGATHEALDIMAPRGTPVLAVDDGRVAKLFMSKAGGVTLYQFDAAGEYAYYYAHLDQYAPGITDGAPLRRGQTIGYVGSTGNAMPDAPHLHFAIFRLGIERQWWRGTPVNPFLVWRSE
jgi:murein DD-endopeptidase MepM/ murein hydrolase activator NlpD